MDRQTDRQTNRWTKRQQGRQRWKHRQADRGTDRQTNRQTARQTNRLKDSRADRGENSDRQTDKQMERQTDGQTENTWQIAHTRLILFISSSADRFFSSGGTSMYWRPFRVTISFSQVSFLFFSWARKSVSLSSSCCCQLSVAFSWFYLPQYWWKPFSSAGGFWSCWLGPVMSLCLGRLWRLWWHSPGLRRGWL